MYGLLEEFYNDEWYNLYKDSKNLSEFAECQRGIILKGKEREKAIKRFSKWLSKVEKGKLKDDIVYALVDEEDNMVGYITGYIRSRDKPWKVDGYLDDLYIKKEYRNKSYGKGLVNTLLKHFKDNGAKYSSLDVDIINPSAIKLYESFGFKKTKYKMQKKLSKK